MIWDIKIKIKISFDFLIQCQIGESIRVSKSWTCFFVLHISQHSNLRFGRFGFMAGAVTWQLGSRVILESFNSLWKRQMNALGEGWMLQTYRAYRGYMICFYVFDELSSVYETLRETLGMFNNCENHDSCRMSLEVCYCLFSPPLSSEWAKVMTVIVKSFCWSIFSDCDLLDLS